MTYDLAVVGHLVFDYIGRGGRIHGPLLGGPCAYSGLAARALDASVAAISTVGRDFGQARLSWLRDRGISVRHVRMARSLTTCFRIDYNDSGRTMKVTSVCDPIEDRSRFPSSQAVHFGPVFQEILPPVVSRLANREVVIGLDPQGFLRRLGSDGHVQLKRWRNRALLKKVTVLKVSQDELQAIVGKERPTRKLSMLGPEIILLTLGGNGIIVWSRGGGVFKVPAYRTRVEDPTGAGDALMGAFLASWLRKDDLIWSAAVGSAVASFVVERFGPETFGTRRQIEDRAQRIFDQTRRT